MSEPPGEPGVEPSVSPGDRPGDPSDPAARFQEQVRAARADIESHVAHARAEFDQANARIKERTGRDLILAILIGVAIGVVVVASLIFSSWPFALFALGATLLGVFEFSRALQAAGRRVDVIPQLIGAALILAAAYLLDGWLHWVSVIVTVALVAVWRLLSQMAARDGRAYAAVIDDVLVGGFVPIYVPFLASFALLLLRRPDGEWWVLAFIVIVVAADTAAYGTGLLLGRHKMAPHVSPGKTWEGLAGAAAAALGGGALLAWLMLGLPWWAGLVLGAAIFATATLGDLGESLIKRDLGIKDMSSWLPGHGGVLDRLDSILPSAATALALSYLLAPWANR